MSNFKRGDTNEVNDLLAAIHAGRVKLTAQDVQAIVSMVGDEANTMPEADYVNDGSISDAAYVWFVACKNYAEDKAQIEEERYKASAAYRSDLLGAAGERGA